MKDGVGGGEHGNASSCCESYRKVAAPPFSQIVDHLIGVFLDLQHLLGVFYIDFSGFGQVPVGAGTVEERGAKFFFQLDQLLVQGRLGNKKLAGCLCDVVFFCDF